MNEPNGIDKVSAALVQAQGELKAALFDSKNPFLRNRYASLGAVISASRPVLLKHGLAVVQVANTDGTTVSVHTSLIHSTGQSIDGGTLALPLAEEKGKSKAQVMGSIITYCRRYAWSSLLGIYADQDDDGNGQSPEPQEEDGNGSVAAEYIQPAEKPGATEQTRMKVLNSLQAAPGQPNRDLVTRFLRSKGWVLGSNGEPETWPLCSVPNTPRLVRELSVELADFEAKEKESK